MGLRARIEREVRAALKRADRGAAVRINRSSRVNVVVVRNVGGGSSGASAEQNAPVVQGPAAGDDA